MRLLEDGKTRWHRPDGAALVHVPQPVVVKQPLRAHPARDGWVLTPEWRGHNLDASTLSAALTYLDHLERLATTDVSAETFSVAL